MGHKIQVQDDKTMISHSEVVIVYPSKWTYKMFFKEFINAWRMHANDVFGVDGQSSHNMEIDMMDIDASN